jgi:hypothetical protein
LRLLNGFSFTHVQKEAIKFARVEMEIISGNPRGLNALVG